MIIKMIKAIDFCNEYNNFNIYINGKSYNIDIINSKDNDINTITDLINYLKNYDENLCRFKNYFILYNNKLISNKTIIKNLFLNTCKKNDNNSKHSKHSKHSIEIIEKQYGGSIIDAFMSIIKIGDFFMKIGKVIGWLLKFIFWFIKFILWTFIDLFNPVNLANDFLQSILLITITVCRIPLDLFIAGFTITVNSVGGWMQGFWGWDMSSLSKADKESNYFQSFNRSSGQKVYYTTQNTVPFSIILGTILCPPMGVFMDLGLTGWFNIMICALLTLLFYLPGLCYALLIIYS